MSDAAGKDAALKITMPVDLTGCHALIEQLACTVDCQTYTIEQLTCTVNAQTDTIEQLRREKQEVEVAFAEYIERLFRKRSERYLQDPSQLRLDLGNTEAAADAAEGLAQAVEEAGRTVEVQGYERRRHRRSERKEELPEHLPRYEVEATVPEEQKHCPQHGARTLIGYDTVETLEFQRPLLRVRVTKYAKYACPSHARCGVASPERPTGLVEGDRYDTSVAAEIITAKYGFHLPVYRQQDLFAGSGWTPQRSTLLNILANSAFVIRPLAEHIKQVVLSSDIVGTDDTRVTLLLPATIPQAEVGDPKSQRIHEVFSEAVAEGRRSVTARMQAGLQTGQVAVGCRVLRPEGRQVAEDVIADQRGQAVQLKQGVLERCGGEQYLTPILDGPPYALTHLARWAVRVPKLVSFVDDDQIPRDRAHLVAHRARVIGRGDCDAGLIERAGVAIALGKAIGAGVQDGVGQVELLRQLQAPLLADRGRADHQEPPSSLRPILA